MFKVGDILVYLGEGDLYVNNGDFLEIVEVDRLDIISMPYKVVNTDNKREYHEVWLDVHEDRFEKIHIDNKLNRKLYPNYVKYKGCLVPEKPTEIKEL